MQISLRNALDRRSKVPCSNLGQHIARVYTFHITSLQCYIFARPMSNCEIQGFCLVLDFVGLQVFSQLTIISNRVVLEPFVPRCRCDVVGAFRASLM